MDEFLVYIKPIGRNIDETFGYEFLFSELPDIVWGPDWEIDNPSSCGDITPDKTTYNKTYKVNSPFQLKTLQETSCYSMEYATFGIIALGWIDLDNLEEYPENGRMVFHFKDTKEKVVELLSLYDIQLE